MVEAATDDPPVAAEAPVTLLLDDKERGRMSQYMGLFTDAER